MRTSDDESIRPPLRRLQPFIIDSPSEQPRPLQLASQESPKHQFGPITDADFAAGPLPEHERMQQMLRDWSPPNLFSDSDDLHQGNDQDEQADDSHDDSDGYSDDPPIPPPMGYLQVVPQPQVVFRLFLTMVPYNPPSPGGHGTGRRVRRRIEIEVGIDVEVRYPDGASR